eukprot:1436081-Rhodomonas_salina.1
MANLSMTSRATLSPRWFSHRITKFSISAPYENRIETCANAPSARISSPRTHHSRIPRRQNAVHVRRQSGVRGRRGASSGQSNGRIRRFLTEG